MAEKSLITIAEEIGCPYLTARDRTVTGWVLLCRKDGKGTGEEKCRRCKRVESGERRGL